MKQLLLALVAGSLLTSCSGSAEPDLTRAEQQQATRLEQIAKASGGDWDKVSEADKRFLVDEVSQGSEQSARMLLKANAGKLATEPRPGGPSSSR